MSRSKSQNRRRGMELRNKDGVVFAVHFSYHQTITKAKIHTGICSEQCEGIVGQTVCGVADLKKGRYSKAKGRKIALARAMHAFQIPRDVRTHLWNEYLIKAKIKPALPIAS